jgi:hypothetical protein
MGQTNDPDRARAGWLTPGQGVLAVALAVLACSTYANLAWLVTNPADYRFFPPFQPGVNANLNDHLGSEYFHIAKALVAGRGFADPFDRPTGPTAWMPPLLPAVLAGLLWLCGGDKGAVAFAVVFLQELVLVGTGALVVALVRRTCGRVGPGVAAAVFILALVWHFRLAFQFTHDCWLVLLALNLLIAGLAWGRPLGSAWRAAGWGAFGGLCALASPVVGFTWAVLSAVTAWRGRVRARAGLALLVAGLVVAPWVGRNYLVFGRLIPVKSNLAFELYQSQCLQSDGVLEVSSIRTHPDTGENDERQEYRDLGEVRFLERKWEQFGDAVRADPWSFADRVSQRAAAATLVYVPFERAAEAERPWALWTGRLTHPLPFLAALFLLVSAARRPLHPAQWAVLGVYLAYLTPYVLTSYYDRYAFPLLGVKALLVLWAVDQLPWWRPASRAGEAGPAG